jgi:hypothetical protein
MKKRKLENQFLGKEENQMTQAQISTKLGDQAEMIRELFEMMDQKEQEIVILSKKVMNIEEASSGIFNTFQMQLEIMQKEIEDLKHGNAVRETVVRPQKVTESCPIRLTKEPTRIKEASWKTVSTKKAVKETNKATSTVKEVLPSQRPQKIQTTEGNIQTSYLQKLKTEIKSAVSPSVSLFKKDIIHPESHIINWTLKMELNDKGQSLPKDSMEAIIKEHTGTLPQSISVMSPSKVQILFKEEDLPRFQKLLDVKQIVKINAIVDNLQQRDITRLAHLYLQGYYKELAHAPLLGLPAPTIVQVLAKALMLVPRRFENAVKQNRWKYNIKKDQLHFQGGADQEKMEA